MEKCVLGKSLSSLSFPSFSGFSSFLHLEAVSSPSDLHVIHQRSHGIALPHCLGSWFS